MHIDDEKGKKSTQTRRDFIRTLSGTLAGALFLNRCDPGGGESDSQPDEPKPSVLGPRVGTVNPYVTEEGKSMLVCVEGSDFNTINMAHPSHCPGSPVPQPDKSYPDRLKFRGGITTHIELLTSPCLSRFGTA